MTSPSESKPSTTAAQPATTAPAAQADPKTPNWERAFLEKLAFAALHEQRSLRRWRNFWRFIWLLALSVVIWLTYRDAFAPAPVTAPHTALIELRGEISADSEASASNIVSALRSAFDNPAAKAVVLLIDSPGGSPVQAGIINDEIWRLKEQHQKPVYAVVEETCASAAYYVAVAADRIYVDKASLVGSIGVLIDGFGFSGLMERLGIERRLLTAGENKGFLDPFSPQTEHHRAYAQQMLDDIHQQFIEVVRKGRGQRLKETAQTFSGLVWTGQRAVAMGLVDDFGNLDYVAREVVGAEDIVDYTLRESVAQRLARRIGAGVAESAWRLARGAWPAWR